LATPIITDGSTDRVRHHPNVVLPAGGELFAERARRFDTLAAGHSMGEFLRLLAAVARAQQLAYDERRAEAVPAEQLAASREYGMPPLSAQAHQRSAAWRADLETILRALRAGAANGVAASLADIAHMDVAAIESLADRILAGTTLDADAAAVPFVGAALQVYFTRLAASLDVAAVSRCDVATICPACATRPVASIIRIGGDRANLRYLSCALCATEWHMTRVRCTSCEVEKDLSYLTVETEGRPPQRAVARAEACEQCKTYLKIFYQEFDGSAEPMADDLATLALDLLVDERGYARSGPNLLLHPGTS
jgi:FdhE protein